MIKREGEVMIISKTKLSYNLNNDDYKNIVTIKDCLLNNLKDLNPSIYLFGSFSKGSFNIDSDYDLLVLVNYPNRTPREMQSKKFEVTECLYDIEGLRRDFDVKLYDYNRFDYLSKETLGYEHFIIPDLIDIKDWI